MTRNQAYVPSSEGYAYGGGNNQYEQRESYPGGRQQSEEYPPANNPFQGYNNNYERSSQQQEYGNYDNRPQSNYSQSYEAPNNQPYRQYQGEESINQPPPRDWSGSERQDAPPYSPQPSYGERPYNAPPPPMYGQDYNPAQHTPGSTGNAEYEGASNAEQGERGVMGALAGGAAGAYGGHKLHHGFIGTVGGAIAGSMAENAYKKHEKEKKQEAAAHEYAMHHQQYDRPPPPPPQQAPMMQGNFHASSRDVRLEGHCTLVADCADVHGRHQRAHLDLNECLTNSDGRLLWARGGNFAGSSRNIRLVDNGNVLEAELGDGRGGWVHNQIWLNERITNDNGRLEMLG